jgi:hypothetical protein
MLKSSEPIFLVDSQVGLLQTISGRVVKEDIRPTTASALAL